MTRNREIDCEDLFYCQHELEIPISDGGEIIAWHCRCGEVKVPVGELDELGES